MRFLSTHPAAILVLLSSYGRGLENVDLNLTQELAQRIMHASPVAYVRDAKLRGSLFEVEADVDVDIHAAKRDGGGDGDGAVCCADTDSRSITQSLWKSWAR
jgi:hypothetical protein